MTTTDHPGSGPAGGPAEAPFTESMGGRVYTVSGGDWEDIVAAAQAGDDRMIVNLGPQHPSTHGVLRLVLELDGETVTHARVVVGYLHTGIEKNIEYRNWTQGTTFVTRADYLGSFFNESVYCMGVEKLLGVELPQRAKTIRILMMELNRISSHLVWLATTGMEIGALSMMLYGFRERELVLDIFEMVTGVRMNHGYVRPGGLAQDLPPGAVEKIREFIPLMFTRLNEYEDLLTGNTIWQRRQRGIGVLDATAAMTLGTTGPMLRASGVAWDLRKEMPYLGYETYDFNVITRTEGDCWARYEVKLDEMRESLKIITQALDRLAPGPVMVEDAKIAWPAQLALGGDGLGNSLDHVKKIMGTSMESLIHHFKLVTEGFRVPPGQAYVAVESPRGELGCHVVSDGGTRPFRVHLREPSYINLQAVPALIEGSYVADTIASLASLDPVLGRGRPIVPITDQTRKDAAAIVARYPKGRGRSALLPMLHLVQSEEGYVTPAGIDMCAEVLGLTKAEVAAVATFYTMYKRRPVGEHIVSVCTNTLCGLMGGDEVYAAVSEHLGIGHNETTTGEGTTLTLEHAECLAACDYAPVLTVDYEFYDQVTVDSALDIVGALTRGEKPAPTRGARLSSFRATERLLAGFPDPRDGVVADGPAGSPTLAGLRLTKGKGKR